jgi:hypothetical protein
MKNYSLENDLMMLEPETDCLYERPVYANEIDPSLDLDEFDQLLHEAGVTELLSGRSCSTQHISEIMNEIIEDAREQQNYGFSESWEDYCAYENEELRGILEDEAFEDRYEYDEEFNTADFI